MIRRLIDMAIGWVIAPAEKPAPLVVRERYRRRTVDLLTLTFVEINAIRDAIAQAGVKLTGTVLSTDWELVEKAPPVPFAEPLLFDPDDVLELTIVLERR